ncbi:MAG TPA: hypothetical protein PK878_15545 [bacterium]|nr:hypothetical protein [Candidatus Omnitrophota bacterium]HOJ61698.1 hypothetical protein [bacterium]HOL94242.1 hypothetical protein [bacterium]HPP03049.1 hypothetical protein [bacterium]HXK95669.1 hypothetical protein [bacterium]
MTVIDKKEESFIAEYMQLLRRTDELLEAAAQEKKNSPPEKQPELDDRIEDIKAIRGQLMDHVKKSGISREILEKTRRLLSIF